MKYKTIGLCGLARTGKDTLCNAMIDVLRENGYVAKRFAIADSLKNAMKKFILDEFGIDVWNCTDEEKTLIRPLLVDYGLIKRQQTNGRFLVEKLQVDIDRSRATEMINTLNMEPYRNPEFADVAIVTDIRYDQYEKDEVSWLKEENEGALVHIKKILGYTELEEPIFVKPPNEQEMKNDPILQEKADYHVEWHHMENDNQLSREAAAYVHDFYKKVAKEVLLALDIIPEL